MTDPARETTPFWLKPQSLIVFVAAVVAVRLYVASATGLVRDEGYYSLWSWFPQTGYLDHPPMVAWFIALGRALLGEGELAVRLGSVLATAAISFAIYRTGRLLLDTRAAGLAVIWYNLVPAGGLLFVATPDTPSVAFWALAVWAVAEFIGRRNANWWLLAGLFAGLGLLSKYTVVFLGAGLLLYLLASRARWGWFRLWQLWAGGAIALLIFLPNLIWNARHDWISFWFQGRRFGNYGIDLGGVGPNLGDLLAGQLLAGALLLFILGFTGVAMFFLRIDRPGREMLALPILTSLPIVLYFLGYTFRFRVEANWLLPVWPMLALTAGWAAVNLRPANLVARLPLAALRWGVAPLGLVALALVYAQAVWQPFDARPAFDRTRDMRGWAQMQAEVERFATANGAQWIATATDYGLTGQLATYGRMAGSELPVRQVDEPERWNFLPPLVGALLEAPAIFVESANVGGDAAPAFFASAELIGEARRMQGEDELERFEVYLVSGPTDAARRVLLGP